ncbi:MAG: LLM class flavin-dependent oxidoreductase [Candidatus Binataceae bacterium]|jgi:alkanesulfonate monooxygenase SsuD/methylene tetrahydromethanopterin reductase-like flavin-dependent oxidoreductase (luciferase family)
MRYGLSFPLAGSFSELKTVADLVREGEAAGWDGCFVWDHLSIGSGQPLADPWIALALIAQATKRIKLGPLVTPIFRRDPGKLAYETVTLDHLSQGRLIMGAGLGSDMFREISAFGGPLNDVVRAEMLDEGLEILTSLWSGKPFSFAGKHYHLDQAQVLPSCLQSPRIPIWIAASWQHKAPMRRAARYDGAVPVRGDLTHPLTPAQIQDVASYVRRFRSADDHSFDVIHFGLAAGLPPGEQKALITSYAAAGVTWWIETMPSDPRQLEVTRRRIRYGPPG